MINELNSNFENLSEKESEHKFVLFRIIRSTQTLFVLTSLTQLSAGH